MARDRETNYRRAGGNKYIYAGAATPATCCRNSLNFSLAAAHKSVCLFGWIPRREKFLRRRPREHMQPTKTTTMHPWPKKCSDCSRSQNTTPIIKTELKTSAHLFYFYYFLKPCVEIYNFNLFRAISEVFKSGNL